MDKQKPVYIAYYRVSTAKQEKSGLGLEAQKAAVKHFTENCKDCVLAEYTEIETGTNKKQRPEFEKAKQRAIAEGAILLIAKLDRLARNVHFISGLMESKVKFKALDMPEADNFTIHIFAALAEREAKLISERTKAALQARKERGEVWKGKSNLTPEAIKAAAAAARTAKAEANQNNTRAKGYICSLREQKMSYAAIAEKLNNEGFRSSTGKEFKPMTVQRLYKKNCG